MRNRPTQAIPAITIAPELADACSVTSPEGRPHSRIVQALQSLECSAYGTLRQFAAPLGASEAEGRPAVMDPTA